MNQPKGRLACPFRIMQIFILNIRLLNLISRKVETYNQQTLSVDAFWNIVVVQRKFRSLANNELMTEICVFLFYNHYIFVL